MLIFNNFSFHRRSKKATLNIDQNQLSTKHKYTHTIYKYGMSVKKIEIINKEHTYLNCVLRI